MDAHARMDAYADLDSGPYGHAVGVGAGVGVAVGAGGTGVAVGVGVGMGLEQAATSAASANRIVRWDSFDMKAAKLLRLGVVPTGILDMKKSLAAAVGEPNRQ